MKHVIAVIALMLAASCAEGPTPTSVGPDPPNKTAVDGNWEVYQVQYYLCSDTNCEVTGYPSGVYGCWVKPVGYLSFTPMPGQFGQGTLVAEVFWTSSCFDWYEQDRMLTLASYTVYVDNGHLMMDLQSLDYGGLKHTVAVYKAEEHGIQLDFFQQGTYVFSVWADYAGDVQECLYSNSPENDARYGYCYQDWHCDVLLASCIGKDDCVYVLDQYDRSHGSWNLGDENQCLELKVPDRPWTD